jgi:putative heme-binding domain-containing protein
MSALPPGVSSRIAEGTDAIVKMPTASSKNPAGQTHWLAVSEVLAKEQTPVEFLGSASGAIKVWLNGKPVFDRNALAAFQTDSDRFSADLTAGVNRIIVRIPHAEKPPEFHLRFRAKSSLAEQERLIALALTSAGNVQRGRDVLFNVEKSSCLKCHRVGEEGGKIGPDLTDIGRRFSRIHLVESLLDPSRAIAPSYASFTVALTSGQIHSGVKIAETDTTLTLGDPEGKTHILPKTEIEMIRSQSKSTMPEGLEKRLTDREFLDLIAYLLSLKQ